MGFFKSSIIFRVLILLTLFYSVKPDQNPNQQANAQKPNAQQGSGHSDSNENGEGTEPSGRGRGEGRHGEHGGNGPHWDSLEDGIYTNCAKVMNKTGQCFGSSDTCLQRKDCDYMVQIERDSRQSKYNFTLYSSKGSNINNHYVAVGLSLEGKMIDTSIVACIAERENNQPPVILPYWSAKPGQPTKVTLESLRAGTKILSDQEHIYCTFQLTPTFKNNKEFKLDEKKYKIYLAVGESEDTDKGPVLHKHKPGDYKISESRYLKGSGPDKPASSSRSYESKIVMTMLFVLAFSVAHL